jgi:hypothetical protein
MMTSPAAVSRPPTVAVTVGVAFASERLTPTAICPPPEPFEEAVEVPSPLTGEVELSGRPPAPSSC